MSLSLRRALPVLALLALLSPALLAQDRPAAAQGDGGAEFNHSMPPEIWERKNQGIAIQAVPDGVCNQCEDAPDFTHGEPTPNWQIESTALIGFNSCQWHEFDVQEGIAYEFTTCSPGGSNFDTFLRLLRESDCGFIDDNDDAFCGFAGFLGSRIIWIATFTGSVKLRVVGWDGASGNYDLAYRIDCSQGRDLDGDGLADPCDTCVDTDEDGYPNPGFPTDGCTGDTVDNCPTVANPGQEDVNANGIGDACECTIDGFCDFDAGENPCICPDDCGGIEFSETSCSGEDPPIDNDCDGFLDCADEDCQIDSDSDGDPALPCGGDCDDDNPRVSSLRDEICDDGLDNDCNEDKDCEDDACLGDFDEDGEIATPCGTDCNDKNPSVGTNQDEDCQSLHDDDCDGRTNCEDSDCTALLDQDGDGSLAPPCGNDCDDNDPTRYPGNEESCTDGFDNDCDVSVDCLDPDCIAKPCDDGFACTDGEICTVSGGCFGTPNHDICLNDTFCDGTEQCLPGADGADANGCLAGRSPCLPGQTCDEVLDACGSCSLDGFEPDNTCAQAGTAVFGSSQHRTLCTQSDIDRVRFLGEPGFRYTIRTSGNTPNLGVLQDGVCVTPISTMGCGADLNNFCLEWTPSVAQTAVLAVSATSEITGDYFLRIDRDRVEANCDTDVFEPDNDCIEARHIAPTTTAASESHSICEAGDVDRYQVLAQAGETYTFWTEGSTDTKLRILDDSCSATLLGQDGCGEDINFCLSAVSPANGFFILEVSGQTADTVGDYIFHYRSTVPPDGGGGGGEPPCEDGTEEDGCVSGGKFLNVLASEQIDETRCIWEQGDEDFFSFFGEAGYHYTFRLESDQDFEGMAGNASCDQLVGTFRTCGQDECLQFEPTASAPYRLRISDEDAIPDREIGETGNYALRYRRCQIDSFEPANNDCRSGPILVPNSVEQIQSHTHCPEGELDWFTFQAIEGRSYAFRSFGGADLGAGILDAGCNAILLKDESCQGSGEGFCLEWTAPQTGTYRLAVTGSEEAPYNFGYKTIGAPNLFCTQDSLESDFCPTGELITPSPLQQSMLRTICAPGDRDYVGFDAVGGVTYEFRTTGGVDTTGRILSSDCSEFPGTFNDDCDQPDDLNFCRTWEAPASGRFYLEIAGYSSEFTVGVYTLEYRVVE